MILSVAFLNVNFYFVQLLRSIDSIDKFYLS